jgi:hypothetical protein
LCLCSDDADEIFEQLDVGDQLGEIGELLGEIGELLGGSEEESNSTKRRGGSVDGGGSSGGSHLRHRGSSDKETGCRAVLLRGSRSSCGTSTVADRVAERAVDKAAPAT